MRSSDPSASGMGWLVDFWQSSIGGKVTMAITGSLLFLFVVAHLLGNLQLLSGPQAINDYARFLHERPALLWTARIGLLVVFALHVATGFRLAGENRRARPVAYARPATVQATFASRSMVFSGLSLLAFVVYHLLHFTFGVTNPGDFARRAAHFDGNDVHAMVAASFGHPGIALAYVAFQSLLFLHLAHGLQSFCQTLGLSHPRYTPSVQKASWVLAGLVAGGNIALALSVQIGLVAPAR
jgi:succinate dehydrogenase / fumarate reductase cytochrome b subunit